jgi:NAD(P)H-dependent flavin oxidoreductase YrpB (nitropropane dioxygenase family)
VCSTARSRVPSRRGHFLSDEVTRQLGTFALLPQIVRAVSVPVIAAGGIADAAGVRAALALGAKAVQIGTAYLLCPEATTSPIHQNAISSTDGSHTAVTNLFTSRPARGIVNRLTRTWGRFATMSRRFPWRPPPSHRCAHALKRRDAATSHHSGPVRTCLGVGGFRPEI